MKKREKLTRVWPPKDDHRRHRKPQPISRPISWPKEFPFTREMFEKLRELKGQVDDELCPEDEGL